MAYTIKGLAGVQEELAKRPAGGGNFEDRKPAKWVSLKGGESVKLVFLQELDKGSPNYSEKNGEATWSIQHSNPDNWRKSAACTADEGPCYACEQGWKQKMVLYINVLVDDGKTEPYVAIWNRGLGKGSVAQDLLNMASDEDFNHSITDKLFKFTRTGTTKDDTTYSLSTLPKGHKFNLEDYELFDLEQYIFNVSYDRQEAYYLDGQVEAPAAKERAVAASSTHAEW